MDACPGCAVSLPPIDGPVHRYMTSTPACWRAFGDLLAVQYASPERRAFHQVVVDAWAAQHPGEGGREQVQSVGLHLMTLCLFLEHGTDPALGSALHRRMVRRPAYRRLERTGPGASTVLTVPVDGPADVARAAAYAWARDVWDSYAAEHGTVRGWLAEAGFTL